MDRGLSRYSSAGTLDCLLSTTITNNYQVFASIHVWTSIAYSKSRPIHKTRRVHCITLAPVIPHGTGKHVWAAPPEGVKVWAVGLFISEIVYTLTLVAVKFSTLAFYWRIFGSNATIHIPIWTLLGVVAAWGIAVVCPSLSLPCISLDS